MWQGWIFDMKVVVRRGRLTKCWFLYRNMSPKTKFALFHDLFLVPISSDLFRVARFNWNGCNLVIKTNGGHNICITLINNRQYIFV